MKVINNTKTALFDYPNHFEENDGVKSKLVIGYDEVGIHPLVSVIMPVYNHPDYFIKSLMSVINQNCEFEYEIIIIDNGHPDYQPHNQAIVKSLFCKRIRYYLNEKNIGGVGSENRGLQLSKGQYVTFCHDDDMLYENALQVLVDVIKSFNKEVIFGNISIIDGSDKEVYSDNEWNSLFLRGKDKYPVNMYDMLFRNYSNGCGTLYNRDCLISIGGFCSDYIPCPDYAMNSFYVSKYGGIAIAEKTLKYRVTPQSDSSTAYRFIIDANRLIKHNIIKSGNVISRFPRILIKANLAVEYYYLYNKWDEKKPKAYRLFFYRILNRLWYVCLLFIRGRRGSVLI